MIYNNYTVIKDDNGAYMLISNDTLEDGALGINDDYKLAVYFNNNYTVDLYHCSERCVVSKNDYDCSFIYAGITDDGNGFFSLHKEQTSMLFSYPYHDTKRLIAILGYSNKQEPEIPGVIPIRTRPDRLALAVSVAENEDDLNVVSIEKNVYLLADGNIIEPITGELIYKDYKGGIL